MNNACARSFSKASLPPRHAGSLHLKWSSARMQQHRIDAARGEHNDRSGRDTETLTDLFRAQD